MKTQDLEVIEEKSFGCALNRPETEKIPFFLKWYAGKKREIMILDGKLLLWRRATIKKVG